MFVLDASVALAWCFPDETNTYADTLLRRLAHDVARVPAIWPLEVANALVVGVRRQRLSQDQAHEAFHLLRELPIEVDELMWSRTFEVTGPLAIMLGLSAYDAAYVELAKRHQCPLATTDARLEHAAKTQGIRILEPSEK